MKEIPFKFTHPDGHETDEVLQIEDNPSAEVMLKIQDLAFQHRKGESLPSANTREYFMALATNLIISAPFKPEPSEIKKLHWQSYWTISGILGDLYPMDAFLFQQGKMLYGRKLKISISDLQTESSTTPPDSASPQPKSGENSNGTSSAK